MLNCTWEDLADYLTFVKKLDNSTVERYKSCYRVAAIYFSTHEFTMKGITAYLKYLHEGGSSNGTINIHIRTLKHICAFTHSDLLKEYTYWPNVYKEVRYLSKQEFKRILKAPLFARRFAHQAERSYVINTALELGYSICARISEIVNIKWQDYDGRSVILRNTKNGDDYVMPIMDHIRIKIDKLPRYNDYMFAGPRGKLYDETLNEALRIKAKRAGIADWKTLKFHALRHSGATSLHDNGVDLFDIKDYLRHKNISSTARYIHTNIRNLKKTQSRHPYAKLTKQDLIDRIRFIVDEFRSTPFAGVTQALEQYVLGKFSEV